MPTSGLVKTMSVHPPRGTGRIRLIRIGSARGRQVDLQPCGGTHVKSTAEIGKLAIGKIEKKWKAKPPHHHRTGLTGPARVCRGAGEERPRPGVAAEVATPEQDDAAAPGLCADIPWSVRGHGDTNRQQTQGKNFPDAWLPLGQGLSGHAVRIGGSMAENRGPCRLPPRRTAHRVGGGNLPHRGCRRPRLLRRPATNAGPSDPNQVGGGTGACKSLSAGLFGPTPGRRAIGGHRPGLARRRSRPRRTSPGRSRGRELVGQGEGFAGWRSSWRRGSCCCRSGRLSVGPPGRNGNGLLPHDVEERFRGGKRRVAAPDHEGQACPPPPRRCRRDTGASSAAKPQPPSGHRRHLAGAGEHRRVEQSSSTAGRPSLRDHGGLGRDPSSGDTRAVGQHGGSPTFRPHGRLGPRLGGGGGGHGHGVRRARGRRGRSPSPDGPRRPGLWPPSARPCWPSPMNPILMVLSPSVTASAYGHQGSSMRADPRRGHGSRARGPARPLSCR